MARHGASSDDAQVMAEVAEALRRAGVRAGGEQVLKLAEPHRMIQQGLAALRARLSQQVEPIGVFNSAEAARPRGGSDGD